MLFSRRLALAAGFALSTLALPAQAQDAPLRIAVVNMDAVIAETDAGKEMRQKLEAHNQQTQADTAALQASIADLRTQITEGVDTLDQSQLVNLRRQLENAQKSLAGLSQSRLREANAIRNESLAGIGEQVDPIFKAIQEEFNYDLILNQQPGVVMMVGDRINITQMVIDRLN